MTLKLKIAERVRKRARFSQDEFAQLLGVSRQTYSHWLGGRRTPRPRHRARLINLLSGLARALREEQWPPPGVRRLSAEEKKQKLFAILESETHARGE